jgi:hypothetical protein
MTGRLGLVLLVGALALTFYGLLILWALFFDRDDDEGEW